MNCPTGKRKYCPEVLSGDGLPCDAQEPEPQLHPGHGDNLDSEACRKKPKTRRRNMPSPLPPTSSHLPVALGGSHWCGEKSFENIVIIGDSYSKSNEGKTWVDHLERQLRKENISTKIHNFALSGATVGDDISNQLSRFFTNFPNRKVSLNLLPALDPDSTTYFIFLGINDCGMTGSDDLEPILERIDDAIHDFYIKAGARNFILVNLPPIDRSPQAMDFDSSDEIEERVKTWNDLLRAKAIEFSASSERATVLLFSSHQVLSEVLEHPSEFDFSEDDPGIEGGGIWEDDLHLTSDVHDILGERLMASVFSQS